MLRIGLIGAGRHGERYLRHLAQGDVAGATISRFWRRDAAAGAAQAAAHEARFDPDLESLLRADDVDALIAAIPAGAHEATALAAAAARKPLLLEKPIAPSIAAAQRITAAFRDANTPLMIAQTLRFDPLLIALRDRALSFGTLRGFTFEQRLEPRGLAWEDDPQLSGGGVLLQTAIHTADALRFVTGAREAIVLGAAIRSVEYAHNEDHAAVTVELDGALGTIAVSKIGAARTLRYALYFDRGTLEADLIERTLSEIRGRARTSQTIPERPTVIAALSAFLAHLRGEGPNPIPGEDATRSLQIIEAAYQCTGGNKTNPPSRGL